MSDKTYHGEPCRLGHGTLKWKSSRGCVSCQKLRAHAYHYANLAKRQVQARAARARNPELHRAANRRWRGIPEPTRPMPERCELCNNFPQGKSLCADHDHISGIFRGWICAPCNTGLGMLRDNPLLMEKAADYVRFGGV